MIRVIEESGEHCLYPTPMLVATNISQRVARAFKKWSSPQRCGVSDRVATESLPSNRDALITGDRPVGMT